MWRWSRLARWRPRSRTPCPPRLRADNWAYQLQDLDLDQLRDSEFDVLVIDYSTTGTVEGELEPAALAELRDGGPCGSRTVLAYMSIGEAEDYRFYWQPQWVDAEGSPSPAAPAFLGPTNPDWPGNYKVRFWRRDWQRLLYGDRQGEDKSYLDRIIDAGFDGIYLDIIDAFEYWGPDEIGGNDERRRAAKDMVALVRRLQRYARKTRGRPDFLVVPQNGAGVIAASSYPDVADPQREAERQARRYFKSVDAIGAEDTFYFGSRDENNPLRPQTEVIVLLDQFVAAGNPVLAIDYLTRQSFIDDFWTRASARGYLPYVSVRDLDRLTLPSGHAPHCAEARWK